MSNILKGIFLDLFEEIKHGDQEHIDWLHDKILEVQNREVNIELEDWDYDCADGCCTWYGTRALLNGKVVNHYNFEDNDHVGGNAFVALSSVLKQLGFNVKIEETYE